MVFSPRGHPDQAGAQQSLTSQRGPIDVANGVTHGRGEPEGGRCTRTFTVRGRQPRVYGGMLRWRGIGSFRLVDAYGKRCGETEAAVPGDVGLAAARAG